MAEPISEESPLQTAADSSETATGAMLPGSTAVCMRVKPTRSVVVYLNAALVEPACATLIPVSPKLSRVP